MAYDILLCSMTVFCIIASFDYTEADCCLAQCTDGYCLDCTLGTPYCGYSYCDFFGCHCIGGCRKYRDPPCPRCTMPNATMPGDSDGVTDARDILKVVDKNGDGKIDIAETMVWLRRCGESTVNVVEKFQDLDTNNDSFISLDELDG